tara:strand:+ start:46 stop:3435 length:3390 start_codon:yes stop_codon:yes gene_type:complete
MDKQILFFRIFNNDFKNLSNEKIVLILKSNKIYKNRIIKEEDFYRKFPDFNIDFYKQSYSDLKDLNNYNILKHYFFNGRFEKRFGNKNVFIKKIKGLNKNNFDKTLLNIDKKLLKYFDIGEYNSILEIYHKNINIFYWNEIKKEINKFKDFDINFYKIFYREEKGIKSFTKSNKDNKDNKSNKDIINEQIFGKRFPEYNSKTFYFLNKELIEYEFSKIKVINNEINLKFLYYFFIEKGFDFVKDFKELFKKYNISRDYFNNFNPEYKNKTDIEFLNLYNDMKNLDLIFSNNDFKKKYPKFNLKVFKQFNLDYKNVEKQNYHLNYNNKRLIGCLEDFYFVYPKYNNIKNHSIDELIIYHKKKIGEIDLDLDELMEIYPDFDQIFYTSVYSDLRRYDKYASIRHWHYHGENEGRIYKLDNYLKKKKNLTIEKGNIDNFDTNNKICIFHCGNIDIFTSIIETYPIIKELNLIITYYNDLYKDKFKEYNLKKYELLKVENRGMDCGPMLLSIKYLLNNNTLYNENTIFYKIHTKKIDKWRDRLISDMLIFNDFNLYKDKPYIFGSNEYIYSDKKGINKVYIDEIVKRNNNKDICNKDICNKDICNNDICNNDINDFYDKYYENFVSGEKINKFTDLLPSLEFYKNYEPDLNGINNLEHWEKSGINEFHRKSNINYIKKYKKFTNYFIAGTIFGFNKKYLDLFKNYNLEYEHSILEEGYIDNSKGTTKLHSWEYYFGLILFLNDGIILGIDNDNNNIYNKTQNKPKIKYSLINVPFKKSYIAIFLILPGDTPESGGFRTILKYIDFLNKCGYSLDIYFGICWNDKELEYNVDKINKDGMPTCENWLNENNTDIIYKILKNIEKYNIIDINSNNFYLGLKCQRKYKVLIANAWQISDAVYKNKEYANSIYYIIQDREELFYPNDEYLKNNVIKTYRKEYNYYCITQYLGNYFKENYEYISIRDSYMGVDLDIYKNLKYKRDNSVVIPYYGDLKPGRKPELVRKIIDILSTNDIKCYVFPYNFETVNENIINLGIMTENELNELYNKHKVGIIFSNTNPSRLGFEMYASGMKVIEYDSEFTKYDMPNEYFKKIKDEGKILNITNKLFNKEYNDRFLKNIDINKDYEFFLNFIKKNI